MPGEFVEDRRQPDRRGRGGLRGRPGSRSANRRRCWPTRMTAGIAVAATVRRTPADRHSTTPRGPNRRTVVLAGVRRGRPLLLVAQQVRGVGKSATAGTGVQVGLPASSRVTRPNAWSPKWKPKPSVSGFSSSAVMRARAVSTRSVSTSGPDAPTGIGQSSGMWNASPKTTARRPSPEVTTYEVWPALCPGLITATVQVDVVGA
ncbi:MAG: hypothetical protein V7646_4222 [Pseudonocardia sp.]